MILSPLCWLFKAMNDSGAVLSNLEFEYDIAGLPIPSKVEQFARRWKDILRLLPGLQEAKALGCVAEASGPLTAWGVTEKVREHSNCELPVQSVVHRVNSKLFSHQVEQRLGLAIPHSQIVSSELELEKAVESCPTDWVLKHPFGLSGRERMVGRMGLVTDSALGWARKRMKAGWQLVFEPWVMKETELSFHFDLFPDSRVEYRGFTELLADRSGVFRGSRVRLESEKADEMRACVRLGAEAVAAEGYWGPLGVDAFWGRLSAQSVVRPITEFNARYSFGRLALALGSWIPERYVYTWILSAPLQGERLLEPLGRGEVMPGVYRLPECADPQGELDSAVLVAESPESLSPMEGALLGY